MALHSAVFSMDDLKVSLGNGSGFMLAFLLVMFCFKTLATYMEKNIKYKRYKLTLKMLKTITNHEDTNINYHKIVVKITMNVIPLESHVVFVYKQKFQELHDVFLVFSYGHVVL